MEGLNFIYAGNPESQEVLMMNERYLSSCWEEMKQGKLFAKEARYVEAMECYNRAIELNSTQMNFFFYRGIARFHLSDLSGALEDLNKTKAANPWNLIDVLNYIACIEFRLGNYKSAKENVARVLSANRGILNDLVMTYDEYVRLSMKW